MVDLFNLKATINIIFDKTILKEARYSVYLKYTNNFRSFSLVFFTLKKATGKNYLFKIQTARMHFLSL